MTEQIYLVRHAQPDWSRSDLVYHLPPGPPLTDEGCRQAASLGAFLRQAQIRQIFSSPLERCLHTAQIAAAVCGAPVQVETALIEWQPGDKTDTIQDRVRPVVAQAATLSRKIGPVALFTHGGPIGALLLDFGMPETELVRQRVYDHHNPVPTAGAWLASRENVSNAWELSLAFKPETAGAAI